MMNSYLIVSDGAMDVVAPDASRLIRFQRNSSVGRLIDELMVNEWKWNVSHEQYYERCQPSECTYQIERRNDFTAIVTTLVV